MVVLAKPLLTCLYKHMQFCVIILAAGQGKRLKSAIPKPLHHLCRTPASWLGDRSRASLARATSTLIVTAADNAPFAPHIPPDAAVFTQDPPQGTGHAVACCLDALTELDPDHPVIILYADIPLIQSRTIAKLAGRGRQTDRYLQPCFYHRQSGWLWQNDYRWPASESHY